MKNSSLPLHFHALPLVAAFMLPNLVTPLLEIWRNNIGFSTGTLSLIFVMYLGGLTPAFILATGFSNYFGRKKILLVSCIFGIISCVGYATASNIETLMLARILTGLCTGFILVLGTDAVLATAKENEQSVATLIGTIGVGVGLASGPILAALVATFMPAPTFTIFVIESILLALCIPIILSQPDSSKDINVNWLPFTSMNKLEKRATLAGLGAFSPGMTAAAIVLALMPTILTNIGVKSVLAGGLMAGGMYIMSPIAQYALRHVPSIKLLSISLIIIIIAMILLILGSTTSSFAILIASAIAIGAGQGLSNYASFKVVHTYSKESTKSCISLLCLGVYASASIIPTFGGYFADSRGMILATVIMAIGVILMSVSGFFIANQNFIKKN